MALAFILLARKLGSGEYYKDYIKVSKLYLECELGN